jgi:hypothetical protein
MAQSIAIGFFRYFSLNEWTPLFKNKTETNSYFSLSKVKSRKHKEKENNLSKIKKSKKFKCLYRKTLPFRPWS